MIKFLMKKLFFIGLSVLLLSGIFLMLRIGRESNEGIRITGGNSFIEDLRIVQRKKGVVVWDLTARRADFYEGGDKAKLSDVGMVLEKNGMVLHTAKGIYDFSDKSFTADSKVKADAKDYRITADSVDFDVSSGDIRTDGRIRLEGKKFSVEGKGMKADAKQNIEVFNDVTATFTK
jgi:LPS export ABC transporter protein LptC